MEGNTKGIRIMIPIATYKTEKRKNKIIKWILIAENHNSKNVLYSLKYMCNLSTHRKHVQSTVAERSEECSLYRSITALTDKEGQKTERHKLC